MSDYTFGYPLVLTAGLFFGTIFGLFIAAWIAWRKK